MSSLWPATFDVKMGFLDLFLLVPHKSGSQPQGKLNSCLSWVRELLELRRKDSEALSGTVSSHRGWKDLGPICIKASSSKAWSPWLYCRFRTDRKVSYRLFFASQPDYKSQVYKPLLQLQSILRLIQKNPKCSLVPSAGRPCPATTLKNHIEVFFLICFPSF